MARIPNAELQRIKREVPLAPLVGRKVKLSPRGKDLVGKCPFHDDDTASFVVTESKGLWHCFGCHAGGTAIDWLMKTESLTFREAADTLLAQLSSTTAPTLPPLEWSPEMSDRELMHAVVDAYHAQLLALPEGLTYLTDIRGLSLDVIKRFRLGYAPKSPALSSRMPATTRDQLRVRLQQLGVIRETGREHMAGRVVVPFVDEVGDIVGMYGRRTNATATEQSPKHLYMPGPHRGILNLDHLGGEVILCESAVDALTFLSHGFTSVTAAFGCEGFTDEMLGAFKTRGVRRVVVAYDHDEPGDHAAGKLAALLDQHGIHSARALFPRTLDANAYALTMNPANKALQVVVDTATPWQGSSTSRATEPPSAGSAAPSAAEPPPSMVADEDAPAAVDVVDVEEKSIDEVHVILLGLRFRVRGLAKLASFDVLKVNVLVAIGDLFHVDTLDLYAAKARAFFVSAAAHELRLPVDEMKAATGRLILALEDLRDRRLMVATDEPPPMSDDEREEALTLLRDPDLITHIVDDLATCGLIGEENNKLLAYLAATSRKLPKPLAVMVQSSSAAGKSSLMEAVLAFIPDEEKVQYSAMTGQSLFYLGDADIKHKVLAIAEEEGAEQASYALKLLQSEGRLRIASTGKDAASGRHVTHTYEVEGPVAILSTTTAFDVDEELLNRCLVLTVDESAAQTAAIHEAQRHAETLEGVRRRRRRDGLIVLHNNAQRLLHPIEVVNPLAPSLSFSSTRTRSRRDQPKLLGLIRAVAFLYQHQRQVKRSEDGIDYIEATAKDVAIARKLLGRVLDDVAGELPPQTRSVLAQVERYVAARSERESIDQASVAFSRRELREDTGLGDTQLKVHLARLVELEMLEARPATTHRQRILYQLAPTGRGSQRTGRAPVGNRSALQTDRFFEPVVDDKRDTSANRSALNGHHFYGPEGEEPQARAAE
jgi:DNA primase catalytic core